MRKQRLSFPLLALCILSWSPEPIAAQTQAEVSAPAEVAKETDTPNLRQSLIGAWAFVGPPESTNAPAPDARQKFWGLKHWVISEADPETGEVIYHHGGTYTLDGDLYTETIKFATDATKELIGKSFKFEITVDGDTFIQTGVNNTYHERWVRLKAD